MKSASATVRPAIEADIPAIVRKFGRWLDCVLMQRALGEGGTTAPDRE